MAIDLPTGGVHLVTCGHLSGGYGNAGMRPERRLSCRNKAERFRPLCRFSYSGPNALNPRGSGTESPAYEVVFTADFPKAMNCKRFFIPESAILIGEELP
jgi:hypothetical protein